jgi:hypothetical protein
LLVRSPWQMSPPAITEVVAAVRLARIDGVAQPSPAKEVAQRAGILACSAVSLLFRQSVPAAHDLSFQASPGAGRQGLPCCDAHLGASNVLVDPDKIACDWL